MIRSFVTIVSLFIIAWGNGVWSWAQNAMRTSLPPAQVLSVTGLQEATPTPGFGQEAGPSLVDEKQVHGLYFYADDCPHCFIALEEVIQPLLTTYGTQLDIRLIEIGNPENYELLINVESYFGVSGENRQIPVLVMGEEILIGEQEVRDRLPGIVEQAIQLGRLDWTPIPGLDPEQLSANPGIFSEPTAELCGPEDDAGCDTDAPIHIVYFYQVGCQSCSRAEADLDYIRSKYPQVIVEEFNIYENLDMADWLGSQIGRGIVVSPAVFIGTDALIGEREIFPEAIEALIKKYQQTGTEKIWEAYDSQAMQTGMLEQFRSMGWLAVVFAGVVDGLNPCAFATIIFFVSYLTLSGRKGREILAVGGAFTIGVFLAYLAVGIGFYKVLELLGSWLTILGKWVYGLTALLCFVLAFFAFRDFQKARKGNIADMELNLPHFLRIRINSMIRQGRSQRFYVVGAFTTGVVISFLELACTGQIYLPTIIFMRSVPSMQLRANFFLVIYNLLFILPLVVVFILAYFGTGSKDLTKFLEKNAAAVKLGMVLLFLCLGIWLTISVIS